MTSKPKDRKRELVFPLDKPNKKKKNLNQPVGTKLQTTNAIVAFVLISPLLGGAGDPDGDPGRTLDTCIRTFIRGAQVPAR